MERLVAQTEAAILAQFEAEEFQPGKVSVWIKLIRLVPMEQARKVRVLIAGAPPLATCASE